MLYGRIESITADVVNDVSKVRHGPLSHIKPSYTNRSC